MIVTDFQQNLTNTKSTKIQPKIRCEYSGGFSNYNYPQKPQPTPYPQNNSIEIYINQLQVQNLTTFYNNKQTKQNDNTSLIYQKQLESTNRLYRNIYQTNNSNNKLKSTNKQEQNIKQQKQQKQQKYAENVYHDDPKFQDQQQIQLYLTVRIVNRIYNKMNSIYTNKYKNREKIINAPMHFQNILIGFIIIYQTQLLQMNMKNTNSINKDNNQQNRQNTIISLFQNHMNSNKIKYIIKRYQELKIKYSEIQKLKECSRFLYCYVSYLKEVLDNQRQYTFMEISKIFVKNKFILLLLGSQLQANKYIKQTVTNQKFGSLIKGYTKPLQVQFNQHKKAKKKDYNKNKIDEDEEYQCQVIKANPIPQSTYKQPPTKLNKKMKTTTLQPFKLTENTERITAQQYYHWNTGFKAQPLPQTTYQPQNIKLLSEQQKKAEALLLWKKASFPKTMINLENYKEQRQTKQQNRLKKYQRDHSMNKISEIPNFMNLHAKQLVMLQTKKIENNHKIDVKPFNLSVNRPKTTMLIEQTPKNNLNYQMPAKNVKKQQKIESRTTKKFDAYVANRQKAQMEKQAAIEAQLLKNKERMEKQQKLKAILKERMGEQLISHGMNHYPYEPNKSAKVKVDYEKIYKEKPLLMKSSLPKKQIQLPWEPIFLDI